MEHLFITGGSDSCVSMWSTSEGSSLLSPFVGHQDSIQSLTWDQPNRLISSSLDKTIRLWDINSQQNISIFSSTNGIYSMNVQDNLIITGHFDRTIKLWDIRIEERRSIINEFKGHNNWISNLKFINNEIFASTSYDGSVKLWNIGTNISLFTISQQDEKVFALDSNNNFISFGGTGQIIRKFNLNNDL